MKIKFQLRCFCGGGHIQVGQFLTNSSTDFHLVEAAEAALAGPQQPAVPAVPPIMRDNDEDEPWRHRV